MKKSSTIKNRLIKYLAFSLLAGAALVVAIADAPAESPLGRAPANPSLAKVPAIQEPGRSGAKMLRPPQAFTYIGGLLLAAFLVRAHARAVLKKHAQA